MSTYDPFTDESAHVLVGQVQMRLGYVAHCLGLEASALASLRAGTHAVVPILGSTLMHTKIARAHHMSEARVAAIWRGCIATFHPDLMARAITEADSRVAAILATAAPEAARDGR